ncbi:carboxylesterase/lipase family protein [Microlunatus speluncae]|uniref:carboxylesterase/lipase family protein n=1 Tax=Microlunatus speluncae TaxID=2594267 RepID=UPI0012664861|nr:carboxylesterase family protein [Microlunatus speluncae]
MSVDGERPLIATSGGIVRGVRRVSPDGPVQEFLGVPYARAERFRPATAVPPWAGIRDTIEYAPAAPQLVDDVVAGSESDCLALNVWRPEGAEGRPIMLWIHGGGFYSGSTAAPVTAGDRLAARHGVIVISVGYRLGALGFLSLDHLLGSGFGDSANLALLDLITALRWVRDHAAALGGDADRITLFGQSAGAAATATLLGMPATEGLFRRAIVQSGTAERAQPPEFGVERTAELLSLLGIPEDRAERLLELPVESIIEAQSALIERRSRGRIATVFAFQPTIDGRWLPELPYRSVAAGTNADVELIVGTNVHESAGLGAPLALTDREVAALPETLESLIAEDFPGRDDLAEQYRAAFRRIVPDGSAAELLGAYLTDRTYRQPSNRLLEARAGAARAATYAYLFTWERSGEPRQGATHALELPFVFRQLDLAESADDLGLDPPGCLADALASAWTSFAATGVPAGAGPGWPEFRMPHRPTLLAGRWLAVAHDPRRELRELLARP